MKQFAGDPARIIPGHDPAVMTRFRQVVPGVVRDPVARASGLR